MGDESGLRHAGLDNEFYINGDGLPGGFSDELLLAGLEDIPMKRWHWISLAFLVLALVRTWLYARGRRAWCAVLLLFLFGVGTVQGSHLVTINITYSGWGDGNVAQAQWHNQFKYGSCPNYGESTVTGSTPDASTTGTPAAGYQSVKMPISWGVPSDPACLGTRFELTWTDASGTHAYNSGWTDYMREGDTANLVLTATGIYTPCYTNVTMSYYNPFAYNMAVNAYASSVGGSMGSTIIASPGQTVYPSTATIPCEQAGSATVGAVIQAGQYTNLTWNVQNDTPYAQLYTLRDSATGNYDSATLNPGQSTSLGLSVEIGTGMNVQGSQSLAQDFSGGNISGISNILQGDLGSGGVRINTNGWVSILPTRINSDSMLTNSPIMWGSNSMTPATGSAIVYDQAANSTLQGGFGVLAANDTLSQAALNNINAALQQMATNRTTVNVSNVVNFSSEFNSSMSNFVSSIGNLGSNVQAGVSAGLSSNTINFSLTNYATESTLRGISNWLGAAITNNFGDTNTASSETNYEYGGATNWAEAVAASAGPLDAVEAILTAQVAAFVIPEIAEGGECSGMVLTFPGTGYQIDFNPTHDHGYGSATDIFYYAKMLLKWLICIYYAKRCLVDSRWAISVCNQTSGSMNPAAIQQRKGV